MIFENYHNLGVLETHVESIFYFKDFTPDHSIERVVPTGNSFLIFELDGFERSTYLNDSLEKKESFKEVWISGMHRNYLSISAHQRSEMLVVQFSPWGARPFLPQDVDQFNDRVIPAENVFGAEIISLRNSIKEEVDYQSKFPIIFDWLLKKFNADSVAPNELIDLIGQFKGRSFSVHQELIKQYPTTQKTLIAHSRKYCGLTPKVLHRIFRFNGILKQIQNKEKINWSDIAYQFGYADQAHFIKEFYEFSGFKPDQFIKQDFHQDPTNFFPLDRKG